MSEADRERWDARYAARTPGSFGVKPWLAELLAAGRPPLVGRALDIAAGVGSNAVALALAGAPRLEVHAWDISPVGLEAARQAALDAGVRLETRLVDLETHPDALGDSQWDLITCFHYRQEDLTRAIPAALKPGGVVVIEVLGRGLLATRPSFNPAWLAAPGELPEWLFPLEALEVYDGPSGDIHVSRFLGRKPA